MTLANDLVSYSIMMNGDKAVSHVSPHYAPLKPWKPASIVTLPPISAHVLLTENNLKLLEYAYRTPSTLSNPLASLLASLPLASPRASSPQIALQHLTVQTVQTVQLAHVHSASASKLQPENNERKRRQRLGPSCDNCRARKVKCDADVVLLSRFFTGAEPEYMQLTEEQQNAVLEGRVARGLDGYMIVTSNNKLVKYRCCLSCAGKGLDCSFSKGFTKEDIGHKRPETPRTAARASKRRAAGTGQFAVAQALRKSSCVACRKRKVKCVMTRLNRCVGCVKKDTVCSLEC